MSESTALTAKLDGPGGVLLHWNKAYIVSSEYTEGSLLVYSGTRNEAKGLAFGTTPFNDVDYIDLRARREPAADQWASEGHQYEDDPERLRSLGWWCEEGTYECEYCSLHDWSDWVKEDKPGWKVCYVCHHCGDCGHTENCLVWQAFCKLFTPIGDSCTNS